MNIDGSPLKFLQARAPSTIEEELEPVGPVRECFEGYGNYGGFFKKHLKRHIAPWTMFKKKKRKKKKPTLAQQVAKQEAQMAQRRQLAQLQAERRALEAGILPGDPGYPGALPAIVDPQTGLPIGVPSPYTSPTLQQQSPYPMNPAGGAMPTPQVYDPGFDSPQSTLPPPPIYDMPPGMDEPPGLEDLPISQEMLDDEFDPTMEAGFEDNTMNSFAGTLITDYNAFSCACDRLAGKRGRTLGGWLDTMNANPDVNPTAGRPVPPVNTGFWGALDSVGQSYIKHRTDTAAARAAARQPRVIAQAPAKLNPMWIGVAALGALLIGVAAFKK